MFLIPLNFLSLILVSLNYCLFFIPLVLKCVTFILQTDLDSGL